MGVAYSLQNENTEIKITYVANPRQVKAVEFVQIVCNSVKKAEQEGFTGTLPSQTLIPPERDAWLDRFCYNYANQFHHIDTGTNVSAFYLDGGRGKRATLMDDAYMIDAPYVGATRFPPEISEIKMEFVTLILCTDGLETIKGRYVAMVKWNYVERKTGEATSKGQIQVVSTADKPAEGDLEIPAQASLAIGRFNEVCRS